MGAWQRMRCILDSGSQIEAITADVAKRLRLSVRHGRLTVNGISGKISVSQQVQTDVMAINETHRFNARFYVIPALSAQPPKTITHIPLDMPPDEFLADDSYGHPGPIDAILGAGLFFDAISEGLHRLPNGLTLQNSKFGWLIGGLLRDVTPTKLYEQSINASCIASCIDDLKDKLNGQDWSTLQHHDLDIHFKEHTTIAEDGRYVVRIPLLGDLIQLGDSLEQAQRRLFSLERKLSRHEPTYDEYKRFMREYLELNHFIAVPTHELENVRYVIPHSYVIKPESTTTKLRVVFDASAKTTSGVSLNDLQAIGPVIQPDLLHVWLLSYPDGSGNR
uniref:DUF1758 domain-containing protein n=1 Tax=Anopheles dirus TaxID=7168 RepID=A0A182NMZ8_9DIPT